MSSPTSSAEASSLALLLEGPALNPPKGVIPHITNRSTEQDRFYVCVALCTVIQAIFLLLRLYTKVRIVRKVDITDCRSHYSTIIFADANISLDIVVSAFVSSASLYPSL